MTDKIGPERRSANMAAIKSKNTKPELAVRSALRALKVGYRLNRRDLVGTPDVVMYGRRKIVLVHGCFWHRHDDCRYAYMPKSRVEFWAEKFRKTVERDSRNFEALTSDGWSVLIIWECETKDAILLRSRIAEFVDVRP